MSLQSEIPGPKRWPVIGNPAALKGLLPFMEAQRLRYGDIFRMKVMAANMVVLSNPEHLQQVLVANRHKYVKGPIYDNSRAMFGDSLLTLDGEAWKHRRALAQPAFHRRSIEALGACMSETTGRYLDQLAARIGTSGAIIDVHTELVKLTMEVVVRALFGADAFSAETVSLDAVKAALEALSERANNVPLPAWVPRPGDRKFKLAMAALERSVKHVIRDGRDREHTDSLLGMLLVARDEHGQPLSERALRDEVVTLFVAGHETSALSTAWVFCMLDGQREVQARVRDEVDSVLGGRAPSMQDVPKLTYLRQVIDETMRLRPSVSSVARNVAENDEIAGYPVDGKDTVLPYIWGAHRHPDHWREPERFDPERFAPGKIKTRHPCSYLPFSGGPRACIGNQFALTEMVIILAHLFTRFDIEVQSCADVQPSVMITTRPSRPIHVKLTPR